VKKLREVIVLQPVMEKNLSLFLKNPSGFPGIVLGRQVVKQGKNGFDFWGKRFWRGIVVFRTPLGW
jgi:hypothetical protein